MKYFSILIFTLTLLMSCKSDKPEKEGMTETEQNNPEKTYPFFLGTYTDGDSKGIYLFTMDQKGVLFDNGLVINSENPSFLTFSKDKNTLLAVNETDDKDHNGAVEAFRIFNDSLSLINKQPSGGAHPCFITANKDGYVLVANYTGGNIGLLKLDESGSLSRLLDVEQHSGKGPTDRQTEPHAHSAWFLGDTNKVISVDLGTDELWVSEIDTTNNSLVTKNSENLKLNPGSGPRHLAFHPKNKWMYVINELNSTITRVEMNDEGKLLKRESVSTLPEDFTGESYCADIHISNDGKFLYGSNRGDNSIVTFKIDHETGMLTLVDFTPVHGDWPRNFALTPDNEYLLVANQRSNNITSFKRDHNSGKLTFTNEIQAPAPVCILFK